MRYQDIEIGAEIPGLSKKIDIVQTVMYCGITWDFVRLHYDAEFARSRGFRQPVVDPQMYGAFFARMMTDWISAEGRLRKLTLKYRAAGFLGDTLTFKGRVADKYVKSGESIAACEARAENQKGECIAEATATVSFP